jgi:hypothetical protein
MKPFTIVPLALLAAALDYYDPDQGLNCTRSGLMSVCSIM